MSSGIEAEGLEAILVTFRQDLDRVLEPVTQAIGEIGRDRLSQYPAPRRAPQAFRSAQQRRGFFAKLRSGQIQVPYQRGGRGSQSLGRKWQIVQQPGPNRVLRNTARYAGLVQGERNAAYHRGHWPDVQQVANEIDSDGTAERLTVNALQNAYGAE
jgi:hypothetical protein